MNELPGSCPSVVIIIIIIDSSLVLPPRNALHLKEIRCEQQRKGVSLSHSNDDESN